MLSRIHVPVASDGSGNVSLPGGYGAGRIGWLDAIYASPGTLANTTDITFTDHETGASLLVITNLAAAAYYPVRKGATDSAGAAITGVAERMPIAAGGIDIAVAQAGNSHSGDLYLWIDFGAQS